MGNHAACLIMHFNSIIVFIINHLIIIFKMRRVYYLSLLACLSMIAFTSLGNAQSTDRRGAPSSLSSGYFIVDSDDNAPAPWRPTYFFLDTTYLPSLWNRVWTGPQQNAPHGHYWFDPTHISSPALMDTVNDCMAGPIWMGLGHHWNFYGGNYDSVYFSSNGFIGFLGYNYAVSSSPPEYCRPNRVDLKNNAASAPNAIIAALWADLDLRHGGPSDTSKVYYYTSSSTDTFIVNYYNFNLRPSNTVNIIPNGLTWSSPGASELFCKKFQIVLANTDSSIQINYGGFLGGVNDFPPVLAYTIFEDNVTIGLVNETSTQFTSVMYGPRSPSNWDAINASCKTCNQQWNQDKQWAIKFKRWIDKVEAVQVDFPTRNYEICLGSSITPQAKFQNVTSSQTLTFKTRFTIANSVTGIPVYDREVSILGLLPGASKDTTFAAYSTNPNVIQELGTFNACAIATTYDTADVSIGDQWPFDDTICTNVFGVRRTSVPFFDPSDGYSKTISADIPDQTLWVSVGATVLEGESFTWDPPPPRYPNGGVGPDNYISPIILMDNEDVNGNIYGGSNIGDTLTSFPINLQGKPTANLTFDFQRTGKFLGFFQFPWDAGSMYGPEWTILNVNNGSVVRKGDSLVLEFKDPAQPGCNPAPSSWHEIAAIDGGRDFEFKKFFMSLTTGKVNVDIDRNGVQSTNSYTVPLLNYLTADFRFRLRLKSNNDGPSIPPPQDDNDPWYIDNPTVLVPLKPEIEVMWVRVVSPYTKIPASEAISLPVYTKIANLSTTVNIAFPIRVQILDPNNNTVYWQAVVVNSLAAGSDTIIQMPNWNAQDASSGGSAVYTVDAWLDQPNFSTPSSITGTYTYFALNVDINTGNGGVQEFAYDAAGLDPGYNSGNDWPGLVDLQGEGVGFNQYGTGSFAMKFQVSTQDTFYGVRAFFGNANQSNDEIRLSLLQGTPGQCTPGDTVELEGVQATYNAYRGPDWNQWSTYYFPKPVVLAANGAQRGVYWASVSQLLPVSMQLGADDSRGGGIVRGYDPQNLSPDIEPGDDDPYGTEFVSGGVKANNGDISCVWAIEADPGSGGWSPWNPKIGWWPTNSLSGIPWSDILTWFTPGMDVNGNAFYAAGSYTPSVRAMVSQQGMLPVQLLYLKGEQQNGTALLTWATATETQNAGFLVQRRLANSEDIFENLGFVASKETNSSTETGYGFIDRNVTPGTYTYRLLQTDVNGAQHYSNEVQVAIDPPNGFSLAQNYPNPFTPVLGSTEFDYTLTVAAPTTMIIYNQLGEVVKTLVNGNAEQGPHSVRWDGMDDRNTPVASGSYICKLISGEFSSSIKVTVSK